MPRSNGAPYDFGNLVRTARQKAGLSQENLADKAGIDRSYLGGVERGERNPTLLVIERIAAGLDLSVAELFGSRNGKQ